jgi:lipopolysaccharide/colanic/teichoic acid biosynthesis glycosyltransferase
MTPDIELATRPAIDTTAATARSRGARPALPRSTNSDARVLDLGRPADISLAPPRSIRADAQPRYERASRIVHATLAGVALVLLSPLFLAIAIAIKLTSRGPIFYLQPRVGINRRGRRTDTSYDRRTRDLGGTIFTIYKFRSMRVDAEKESGAVWATRVDSRVTAVGRFLRKTRLDELPQLINVLQGNMNIVGPRPERPGIFARLSEDIAEYPLRQRARPGITGWAQVNQPYDSCVDDVRRKVQYDLEYLERRSVVEDFKIMVKTVPVMLFYRGGW